MRRPVGTSAIWFLVGVVVGAAGSALVLGAIYYLSFSRPSTPAATHPSTPQDPITTSLPPLPWSVETRTTAGRVLSRMTVRDGDVACTTPDANGRSSSRGDGARVDLSCGRLDVWTGPPMLGPIPGPGQPGDCDP